MPVEARIVLVGVGRHPKRIVDVPAALGRGVAEAHATHRAEAVGQHLHLAAQPLQLLPTPASKSVLANVVGQPRLQASQPVLKRGLSFGPGQRCAPHRG